MKVDVKFWTIVAVVIAVTMPTIVRPFISQILDGIDSENPIYLLFVRYRSLWISVLVVMTACFCEKQSLLSLGLGLPTLRRGLITSVFGSIAILGGAILFSLIHADRPLMFVHLAVVAPLLGVAYHWSKSVWPGVIIHYVGNIIGPLIFKWIVMH